MMSFGVWPEKKGRNRRRQEGKTFARVNLCFSFGELLNFKDNAFAVRVVMFMLLVFLSIFSTLKNPFLCNNASKSFAGEMYIGKLKAYPPFLTNYPLQLDFTTN